MTQAAGVLLSIILLGFFFLAVRVVWRHPFRALGILVGGMAIHNLVLMVLLRLGTPGPVIRIVQSWKEGLLLLLLALVLRRAAPLLRARRLPRLLAIDWVMIALAGLILVYFVLPSGVVGGHASLSQRVLGARVLLLLPLLYLFGRVFFTTSRADLVWNLTVVAGSGALVAFAGLIELWLVPTRTWLDAGVNLLSAWLGFQYHGPQGLPENFFQTAGVGYYLRRMVSTYVSPLPIAYTGLLIVPLAISLLLDRKSGARPLRIGILVLVIFGILFSVTRLAMVSMVGELLVLGVIWRRRWILLTVPMAALLVAAVFYGYPHVGPLVTANLEGVPHRPSNIGVVSRTDPSAAEHAATLAQDLQYVVQHPLGTGLGTSIHRFGQTTGTGESAFFDVFGEIGYLGGLLYVLAYGLMLVYGLRAWLQSRGDPLLSGLALVSLVGALALAPIMVSSDIWSDFTVTFLVWWAAGFTVSLANLRPAAGARLAPALRVPA
jgi:hypothetical protein